MFCGHTLLHSPQSVQRPATWNARITWNIFSSKSVLFTLAATPDSGYQIRRYGMYMLDMHYDMHCSGYTLTAGFSRNQNAPALSLPQALQPQPYDLHLLELLVLPHLELKVHRRLHDFCPCIPYSALTALHSSCTPHHRKESLP